MSLSDVSDESSSSSGLDPGRGCASSLRATGDTACTCGRSSSIGAPDAGQPSGETTTQVLPPLPPPPAALSAAMDPVAGSAPSTDMLVSGELITICAGLDEASCAFFGGCCC